MATRIQFNASVSYEYDHQPVQTYRGAIVAANASQAARRALQAASKTYPNSRPRSIVVVLELGERTTVAARKRGYRPGDVHPVDAAILGGDPSL